ncbi:MAG: DUF695 domain-containing protein [Deltaproteobacteria bacterium]|nr:DUF695 domain-containing protein [Deltaproteobacteria bacterium]
MPPTWEPDFDFYITSIDEKPASIVVDLAAAKASPVESHPVLLGIRVPMRQPREDGLRDAAELDALGELEDRFTEALEAQVDALYVGRVVHDGATTLYYYAPEAHRQKLDDELPAITGDPGDYAPEWWVDDDPKWQLYDEFLTPDEYDQHMISNRRLIAVFTENGDKLEEPRQVDHFATFPSRQQAERAAGALRAAGFATDDLADPDSDDAWELQFHRVDHLAEGRPDEFVGEILDLIEPEEGDYDGWGAPHAEMMVN